jgi:hypothetical protein
MLHTSTHSGKTSTKHQPATPKPTTPKKDIGDGIDREKMISVAAYFHAEHRGLGGGDPLSDWLAAETEIDEMLKKHKDIKVH